MSEPAHWGRVAEDGTVFVLTTDGERPVGVFAGPAEKALEFYASRYESLAGEVAVLEARLGVPSADPRAIRDSARKRLDHLGDASVVGDLQALEERLRTVMTAAQSRLDGQRAARAAERAKVSDAKRALVEEAETLATSTEWKTAGDRLTAIVDEWTGLRGGDRSQEQDLWR